MALRRFTELLDRGRLPADIFVEAERFDAVMAKETLARPKGAAPAEPPCWKRSKLFGSHGSWAER